MSKILTGKIVSLKMQKTAVLVVERKVRHPLYKKIIKKAKRYKAHYNGLTLNLGDIVKIQETKPISRDKHFKVIKIIKK